MKTPLNARSSTIINMMRFPLIAMVVLAHSVIQLGFTSVQWNLSGDNLFHITENFFFSLGVFAVTWFSLISGYFFVGKNGLGVEAYGTALRKRFHSLLIPYILWNAIYIVVLWSKNYVAGAIGFAPGVNQNELGLYESYSPLEWFLLPINHPLWYVRELIYLTIISPIFYWSIRYLKEFAIIGLAIAYLFIPQFYTPFSDNISFYFCLGMYLSYRDVDVVKLCHRLRWVAFVGALAYVPIIVFFHKAVAGQVIILVRLLLLIFLFNVFAWIYDNRQAWVNALLKVGQSAFFVYSLHVMIFINLIRGTLYTTPLADSGWGKILIYFATGGGTLLCCLVAYYLSRRFLPRLTAILSGGR